MRIIDLFKLEENKSLYHYLFKSSVVTLLIQGLAVLLLFGINYFIEERFGTKTLGVYAKIVFWINLLATISLFGFDDLVNKYWNNTSQENGKKTLLIYSFKGVLLASLIVSFLFFFLAKLFHFSGLASIEDYYFYFIWIVPISAFVMLFQVIFKAEKMVVFSLVGENLIKPVLFLISLLFVSTITGVISVYSLSILLTFFIVLLVGFFYVKNRKANKCDRFDQDNIGFFVKDWKKILKFFIFLQISTSVFDKLDYVTVSLNLTDEDMAYFSIVSKIVVLLSLPITIVNSINAPLYSQFVVNNNLKGLETYFRKSTQGVFIVTIISSIVLSFMGFYVLMYFGDNYLKYFPLLLILILDRVARTIFGSIVYLLTMIGQERIVSSVIVIYLILGSIFVSVFTIKFGVYGASISYAVIRIMYLFTLFILAKNKLNLKFWIFK